ncbi:hypothetical protein SUGI_1066450 [Cryptomeria japonica]|nr:hypothetical protein SUGI_1066450 [Cryptomeria japonica]
MLLMGIVALFTLGDSIVDPGNNNYLPTIAKGNHPRYGQDFTDKRPTSRLSNGKLTTHFRAASLGLEDMLPAYLELDLKTQDFLTDVSFASAGTGYDNLIVMSYSVIPMWKQVEMFKECKACLEDTEFLLQISSNLIQDLYKVGAHKVGVTRLPPLGCLPLVRDNQRNSVGSSCIEEFNQIAILYSTKTQEKLAWRYCKLTFLE